MRVAAVALVVALVLCAGAACLAQEAPSRPEALPRDLSPQQKEALERGTALFIITILMLLLMVVVLVIFSIALRRRVAALEQRQERAVTQLEDLWWRMEGPNPFENDKKKDE